MNLASFKLVLATGNAGKVRDFQTVFQLASLPVEVLSMESFGGMPVVDETEPDFAGNARLKAEGAKKVVGDSENTWVLADDSGICVDVLNGEPGIHSARFAGADASDADNRQKLLDELSETSDGQRGAYFMCHLHLISPTGERYDFVGTRKGKIAFESFGGGGFGYDPLFIPTGSELTWGEMEDRFKNDDSHRSRATQQLIDWVQGQF